MLTSELQCHEVPSEGPKATPEISGCGSSCCVSESYDSEYAVERSGVWAWWRHSGRWWYWWCRRAAAGVDSRRSVLAATAGSIGLYAPRSEPHHRPEPLPLAA
ncbi:hypothetical protein BST61_g10319 [Cercospora zeina]